MSYTDKIQELRKKERINKMFNDEQVNEYLKTHTYEETAKNIMVYWGSGFILLHCLCRDTSSILV